jgi:hypothetical protein
MKSGFSLMAALRLPIILPFDKSRTEMEGSTNAEARMHGRALGLNAANMY